MTARLAGVALVLASCTRFAPLGTGPFLLPSTMPTDGRPFEVAQTWSQGEACSPDASLGKAKSQALAAAQADFLVDVSVDSRSTTFLFIFRSECTVVRGRGARFLDTPAATAGVEAVGPGLADEVVDRALARLNTELASCRMVYGADRSTVTARFTLVPTGEVSAVAFEDLPAHSDLASCVSRVLRQLRFPSFRGGPATYRRRIKLSEEVELDRLPADFADGAALLLSAPVEFPPGFVVHAHVDAMRLRVIGGPGHASSVRQYTCRCASQPRSSRRRASRATSSTRSSLRTWRSTYAWMCTHRTAALSIRCSVCSRCGRGMPLRPKMKQ